MYWHHFWVMRSLKLWLTNEKSKLHKNVNFHPPLLITHSLTHKQPFPFVSSYCFFWSAVKTKKFVTKEKKRRNAYVKNETGDMLRDGPGSQLRVKFTVSYHSDWWLTAFATLQITAKETNIRAQHDLDPTLSCVELHLLLTRTSATLLPVFLLPHLPVVDRWCLSAPHMWWWWWWCPIPAWWGQETQLWAEGGVLSPAGGG